MVCDGHNVPYCLNEACCIPAALGSCMHWVGCQGAKQCLCQRVCGAVLALATWDAAAFELLRLHVDLALHHQLGALVLGKQKLAHWDFWYI